MKHDIITYDMNCVIIGKRFSELLLYAWQILYLSWFNIHVITPGLWKANIHFACSRQSKNWWVEYLKCIKIFAQLFYFFLFWALFLKFLFKFSHTCCAKINGPNWGSLRNCWGASEKWSFSFVKVFIYIAFGL